MNPYFGEWMHSREILEINTVNDYVSSIRNLFLKRFLQRDDFKNTKTLNKALDKIDPKKGSALQYYIEFVSPELLTETVMNKLRSMKGSVPNSQQSRITAHLYDRGKIIALTSAVRQRLEDYVGGGVAKGLEPPTLVLLLQTEGVAIAEKELTKVKFMEKPEWTGGGLVEEKEPPQWFVSENKCFYRRFGTKYKTKKLYRYIRFELSEVAKSLVPGFREGEPVFQTPNIKRYAQVVLTEVIGVPRNLVEELYGYGHTNDWVNRAKVLYLVSQSEGENGEINVEKVDELAVRLNFHFGKSSGYESYYNLIQNLKEQQIARLAWKF